MKKCSFKYDKKLDAKCGNVISLMSIINKSVLLKLLFVFNVTLIVYVITFIFVRQSEKKQLEDERVGLLSQFELLNQKMDEAENILLRIQKKDDATYRDILEADPLPESIKKAGFGGVNLYRRYEGMMNSDVLVKTAKRIDILSTKLTVQSKSFDKLIILAKEREKKLSSIPSVFPLNYSELQKIGSGFGYRRHPILGKIIMHKGVDLVAKRGAKIKASGKGVVVRAGYSGGYGKCVKIDHGYGYVSVYAHMSKILVKKGQTVKHHDTIGLVGNTGRSTGPHLHYEVQINGKVVNPEKFYSLSEM